MTESVVHSAEEMMELGREYAIKAKAGDVFGLVGTLGTGKTHWTKGFVKYINPDTVVSSPTFAIVNEYPSVLHTVYHFDFYRLKSDVELVALGWDEYLEDGAITICEWADLFPEMMPENTIWLEITHTQDESRKLVTIEKPTARAAANQ